MKKTIPNCVVGADLRDYFLDHVTRPTYRGEPRHGGGFFTLKKPLCGFKKIYHGVDSKTAIVSLLIPAGASVYVGPVGFGDWSDISNRKMRASLASVKQIALKLTKEVVTRGYSQYTSKFKYRTGCVVRPAYGFSKRPNQCDGGIHFFLNVKDAYDW